MRLNYRDIMRCPFCGKPQDDRAENFFIPLTTGPRSRAVDRCIECDEPFTVENNGDETVTIYKGGGK